jgi:predicted DNA binding protein
LKDISLDVEGWEEWSRPILSADDVNVRVVNCRPHEENGMVQYVEISTKGNVDDMIAQIRANPNVVRSEFTKTDQYRASGLVITKRSRACRAVTKNNGFCSTCLISGDRPGTSWRIVLSADASLGGLLTDLEGGGMQAKLKDFRNLQNGTLTVEQIRIVKSAEEQGYFEFPRKVSLTDLALRLGMSKSNLDEILRRAEHKIVANYVKKSNGNAAFK